MKREKIDSSNLESIGYDPATRLLEVEFKNGGLYRYEGVEPELYQELMETESKGRFLSQKIKGRYRADKIEGIMGVNCGEDRKKACQEESRIEVARPA